MKFLREMLTRDWAEERFKKTVKVWLDLAGLPGLLRDFAEVTVCLCRVPSRTLLTKTHVEIGINLGNYTAPSQSMQI